MRGWRRSIRIATREASEYQHQQSIGFPSLRSHSKSSPRRLSLFFLQAPFAQIWSENCTCNERLDQISHQCDTPEVSEILRQVRCGATCWMCTRPCHLWQPLSPGYLAFSRWTTTGMFPVRLVPMWASMRSWLRRWLRHSSIARYPHSSLASFSVISLQMLGRQVVSQVRSL